MSQLHKKSQDATQFRENWWKIFWAACLIALCLSGGGCGKSGPLASQAEIDRIKDARRKKSSKEEEEYKETLAVKLKAKEEAKAEIERKRELMLAQRRKGALQKQKSKAKRSQDVKAWKKRDYYEAKAEVDSRLVDAVKYLGNEYVGNDHAAQLLAELLMPGLPPGMSDIKVKAARGSDGALTDALVAALVQNHTEIARNSLIAAVVRQESDDKSAVAQRILQCLAEKPAPHTESIILEALLHPPKLADKELKHSRERRQTRTIKGTQPLARVAQAAMANGVSGEFREKLARRIIDPDYPSEYRVLFSGLLLEPWPENLSAQMVLFEDINATRQLSIRLQTQWAAYCSEALRRLYGTDMVSRENDSRDNGKVMYQSRRAAAADTDLVARVMHKLWGKRLMELIEDRLYRASSLEQSAATILLAATMPRDSVRKSVHDNLVRNWQDGPKALDDLGLFDQITCDPGFWLVLKSCSFSNGRSADNKKSRARKNGRGNTQVQQDPWQGKIVEMLLANCACLEKAAYARRLIARRKGDKILSRTNKGSLTENFPIQIHDKARPVEVYRLAWPEDMKDFPAEHLPDGTKLSYAKFHQTGSLEKIAAHYRGRMQSPKQHMGPKGCWLESLATVEGTGRMRSVDVVIQKTSAELPISTSDDERLVIDIIIVEIKNPAVQ